MMFQLTLLFNFPIKSHINLRVAANLSIPNNKHMGCLLSYRELGFDMYLFIFHVGNVIGCRLAATPY